MTELYPLRPQSDTYVESLASLARFTGLGPPRFLSVLWTETGRRGGGFIDQLDDAPACADRFEAWREQVVDDVGGEWSG
jgi:hypothetical protein